MKATPILYVVEYKGINNITQPETSQSHSGNQRVQTTIIFRTEESYYTFVPTTYIYIYITYYGSNKINQKLVVHYIKNPQTRKRKEEGKIGKGTLLMTVYCAACILMRTARLLI